MVVYDSKMCSVCVCAENDIQPPTPVESTNKACSGVVQAREDVQQRRTLTEQDVINMNGRSQCAPTLQSANCVANMCYNQRYRTMDGTCNNIEQPLLGAAFMPYTRLLLAAYDDGRAAPSCMLSRVRTHTRLRAQCSIGRRRVTSLAQYCRA
jgi:hypothetical protein